jgi:glutathione S-transferase
VAPPLLWHLKVSNYNEKARWALDFKDVAHERRAVVPGRHGAIAQKLTGGTTFPILVLDGEAIGDSTKIIAALERRHPEPALYPSDPQARRRALELEDFFDEELGPHTRLIVVDHLLADAALFLGAFAPDLTAASRKAARETFPNIRKGVIADMGIDGRSVELAYERSAPPASAFERSLSRAATSSATASASPT